MVECASEYIFLIKKNQTNKQKKQTRTQEKQKTLKKKREYLRKIDKKINLRPPG